MCPSEEEEEEVQGPKKVLEFYKVNENTVQFIAMIPAPHTTAVCHNTLLLRIRTKAIIAVSLVLVPTYASMCSLVVSNDVHVRACIVVDANSRVSCSEVDHCCVYLTVPVLSSPRHPRRAQTPHRNVS